MVETRGPNGSASEQSPEERQQQVVMISAEQRAAVRLTRDEKRMIFFMNKALEQAGPSEKANILRALNINAADLQPIPESEFKKLIYDPRQAFVNYKFHHDRRLTNYYKLKDFMDQAQRRHSNGRCIYLSKEGQKLLMRRQHTKSISGTKNMVLRGLEFNEQNMPSIERSAEREKQTARLPAASAHAMSPHKNALTKK